MRKVLIVIFLSFSFIANSQVWISKGAVWHYEWSGVGSGGFESIEYVKDSLIDNKLCNKLMPINYHFVATQNHEIVLLRQDTLPSRYTYVSGDTVFHLVNDKFYVLYNFGAKPGDSWNIGVDTNIFKCSESIVKVDSIGTIIINSETFRWISLSTLPYSSMGLYGKVIERFGAIEDYLFPIYRNCDTTIAVDFNAYTFSCYQDDTFPLYNVINKDCEYLLTIGIPEPEQVFEVYPIPTKGKLFFSRESSSGLFIRIYTVTGKEVFSQHTTSNEVDLSDFKQGVYFLRIDDKYKKTFIRKIVKINN